MDSKLFHSVFALYHYQVNSRFTTHCHNALIMSGKRVHCLPHHVIAGSHKALSALYLYLTTGCYL